MDQAVGRHLQPRRQIYLPDNHGQEPTDTKGTERAMTTLLTIILGLLAVILALLVLAASMYLAIVLYHEARWRQAKSDKYEQHNR